MTVIGHFFVVSERVNKFEDFRVIKMEQEKDRVLVDADDAGKKKNGKYVKNKTDKDVSLRTFLRSLPARTGSEPNLSGDGINIREDCPPRMEKNDCAKSLEADLAGSRTENSRGGLEVSLI